MSITQCLRVIWARKWLVLALFVVTAVAGTAFSLSQPKLYTADASLVVEARPDPVLGMLTSPIDMSTQIEILLSDKVASRVVQIMGIDKSPGAVQQWREATGAKIPMERFFANRLQNGLSVEPLRGSNIITITYSSPEAAFAAAAANAFAQAAVDVSIDLRVEPARQSAVWFDQQMKDLRAKLEEAQARLSKYQQEKGIVVSDERLDQENARLNALASELAAAQAELVDASGRQRSSGSEISPDVQQSAAVQGIKGQLASAEAKLAEISSIVGSNHPQRLQLEAQIAGLRQQLAAEMRRVSGGTSVVSRASSQKVAELRSMMEQQKKQLLSLRSERDQISVLLRDVESAQRAYEGASQRLTQLSMESQTNQANIRLLSAAVEPMATSQKKVVVGVIGSIVGGLILGALVALGLEFLDRRVRGPEDLAGINGVPVIGILRPVGSKQPVFRRLASTPPRPDKPVLPMAGAR
jgi:chain length determinant protein EpsF